MLAHNLLELGLNNLEELLAGIKAAINFLPQGALLDLLDKIFDYRQGNIRFQKRHAHFPQRILDIGFAKAGFTGYFFKTIG